MGEKEEPFTKFIISSWRLTKNLLFSRRSGPASRDCSRGNFVLARADDRERELLSNEKIWVPGLAIGPAGSRPAHQGRANKHHCGSNKLKHDIAITFDRRANIKKARRVNVADSR
jgi:hypothetical protein